MEERRSNIQLIVSVSSILSVLIASMSIISFIQLAERRITTMEIRIEGLAEVVKENRVLFGRDSKMKQ